MKMKRGVSYVLSVVVITAILLSTTIALAIFTSIFLQSNLSASEFRNAENAFVYLADIINSISTETNGSGTIKLESRFFGPSVLVSLNGYTYSLNLTVKEKDTGVVLLSSDELPRLENMSVLLCKTTLTGVASGRWIYGNGSIVVEGSEPIVQVREGQEEGAYIRLDAFRAMTSSRGVIENFATGEKWGYVTIYLVNLTRGQTNASSPTFFIRAWVKDLVSCRYELPVQTLNISAVLYKEKIDGGDLITVKEGWEVFDFTPQNVEGVILTVIVSQVELTIF